MHTMIMPSWWESLLKRYLKRTFYEGTRRRDFADRGDFTEGDYRFFVKGVRDLNVYFTQERGLLPKNYLNRKELRSGYILYFMPVNALKVAALLEQLPPETLAGNDGTLTIIDVGCGPGTGMLGTFLYLENLRKAGTTPKGAAAAVRESPLRIRWVLIDQNRHALDDAQGIHDLILEEMRRRHPRWEIRSEIEPVVGDVFMNRLPRILHSHRSHAKDAHGANLILGLNLLGEIARERRLAVVQDMVSFLHERGRVLLMEPALRRTSRDLMALHDDLLENELAWVYAPCLHQAACPMLVGNERDWCHAYIPWERPRWLEKIDRLIALRKEYPKCSYLILGGRGGAEPAKTSMTSWRVVSGPLNSKGKSERLLCGEDGLPGLLRIMRLDKDASPANHAFDDLERGDIVEMRKTSRVARDTTLKRI